MNPLPAFPYGAVYFRKSNPPRANWAANYAATDGMNAFRHWFLWGADAVVSGREFEIVVPARDVSVLRLE